jgi:hypothetical protein
MSRLIAFGASITYGQGLEDCYKPNGVPGDTSSKHAWPQILADLLNLECINASVPGDSCKDIWYNAVNFEYKPDDVVFVEWCTPNRWAVFNDDGSVYKMAIWNENDKVSDFYYRHMHSDRDVNIDFYMRAEHLQDFFAKQNIKYFSMLQSLSEFQPKPAWCSAEFEKLYSKDFRKTHPLSRDNSHPGELAHREYAKRLLVLIEERL